MNELTYRQTGDYLLPNLTVSETELKPLGKYGRMRKRYLKEHRPILWNQLLLDGILIEKDGEDGYVIWVMYG